MTKLIKKHERLLTLLFLVLTVINIFSFIYKFRGLYTEDFSPENHRKLYGGSQYVNKTPLAEIGDEIVYAFAAWENINGANPILINGEQPPLGKYFIGLSELWFDNTRLTAPLFNILSLVALFWLLYLLLDSALIAALMTCIFSFEKVFLVQMQYAPNLDNIQLFFVLAAFAFFVKYFKTNKYLIPAFISLGCAAATKFWITGFIIYVVWLLSILLTKDKKRVLSFLLTSPLILVPMLISYIPAFSQGLTLKGFFGHQKFIYAWHKAKLEFDPVGLWDFLLLGRWHFQGEIQKAVDWQITWPIVGILSLFAIYKLIKSYKTPTFTKNPIYITGIWFLVYFAMLSASTVNGRYLLAILPALYALSGFVVKSLLYGDKKSSL